MQNLTEQLVYRKKNSWDKYKEEHRAQVFAFSDDYRSYLDAGKTERECVDASIRILEAAGFKNLDSLEQVLPGDKIYKAIKAKGLIAAVAGKEPMTKGLSILGAHIDSPRLDLKPTPLYEDNDMGFLKTHYYGGIKKYQWTTIPLALHGVVFNKMGETIHVNIGEKDDDPVFTINELLVHLSQEQLTRKAAEAVKAEELNVLFGSLPVDDSETKERVKLGILKILSDMYQINEQDLISAELELVPASKARDVGLDRSFIGAYGQDDRVCAYTALRALVDIDSPEKTCMVILTDKEEVGSGGNTGAQSRLYENTIFQMLMKTDQTAGDFAFRTCLENSQMLSADVTAGFDPAYAGSYDKRNAAYMGKGVCLIKYTGARGKSGASDANGEFFNKIIRIFDEKQVPWQTGEMGRVDLGGGGTIAVHLANMGMEVIDCGVPVLSMHAPMEVTSKADVYSTYIGFREFLNEI